MNDDAGPMATVPTTASAPLLDVRGLRTAVPTDRGLVWPVDGVDFTIDPGQTVALVGESGSGKSLTARSLVGLLPDPIRVEAGEVLFKGEDLLKAPGHRLTEVRGDSIGFIFQDPMSSLNPTLTVGFQITEPLRRHRRRTKRQARAEAVELLGRVGIPAPRARIDDYPHEFSGGMRQRVVIAMALACQPELIIADEPTTALDVTVQAQIVDLLMSAARELSTSLLLITHDLSLAAELSDRIIVMYAGRIVEEGAAASVLLESRMPYTTGLLNCLPTLDGDPDERLIPIPGRPPELTALPPGCRFQPRCHLSRQVCEDDMPELVPRPGERHLARCFATQPSGWAS